MPARVLYVDDEQNNRTLVELFLKSQGYEVATAADGAAFLEAFDRQRPDLCICDIGLPDTSGIELLKQVKDRSPSTPVVMLTASESQQDAVAAWKAGALDWLSKPIDRERLFATVRNALTLSAQADELGRLRRQVHDTFSFESIVGDSPRMREAKASARKVAASEASVLVRGESGTGKELFAKALHFAGSRAKGPFVDVNCAAMTESLLESEIFGHEKGAFTGAVSRRIGKFEQAHGGTIFLDEIGDMPLATQAKLLRVLQERAFSRVGGNERVEVDVRVVSATNQDLEKMAGEGRFRQDLYYRINTVTLEIPPLRERMDDLPSLAKHFVAIAARREKRAEPSVGAEAMRTLASHSWPGNVRELENCLTRAVILCDAGTIEPEHLPKSVSASGAPAGAASPGGSMPDAVERLERAMITEALEKSAWIKARAARALGLTERVLAYKMDSYGIQPRK